MEEAVFSVVPPRGSHAARIRIELIFETPACQDMSLGAELFSELRRDGNEIQLAVAAENWIES
jgi:hypothetical protein